MARSVVYVASTIEIYRYEATLQQSNSSAECDSRIMKVFRSILQALRRQLNVLDKPCVDSVPFLYTVCEMK